MAELEAIAVHARAYVGSPCAGLAMQSIVAALTKHELLKPMPDADADVARKERTGGQKRAIAREVLRELEPDSPLGLLMGLGNHEALAAHVPVALRNGLTVPQLEEFVYQAATYLGYISGAAIRKTVANALKDTPVK